MPAATATDHAGAAALAYEAGILLREIRSGLDGADAPATVRARGDREAHEFLHDELGRRFPADAVLSEEGVDDPARLGAARVWVIDPLDGTREFGEAGRTDWAVHVALVVGGDPVAGAVALPARDLVLATAPPPSVPPAAPGPLRLVVSRTRPPEVATRVAAALGATIVPMGSAGAKAMAILTGEADVYVHAGGQHEWDSAAPVAVALAAGLHASRLDGTPLRYNQPDPWLPDLVVCRPELAPAVLAVTREPT